MTRDELINWLTAKLWTLGVGNVSADAHREAESIVDTMDAKDVLRFGEIVDRVPGMVEVEAELRESYGK